MSTIPENPKVSVIIPTYNRAELITEAIDSVLAQTSCDYEIIVVDDGSSDNTREILAAYNTSIRYLYQKNQGVSAARNAGIKQSKGQYIAFLDSDDLWLPHKLTMQTAVLDNDNDVAFVYSNFIFVDEAGKFLKIGCKPDSFASGHNFENVLLVKTAPSYPSTWMLKKSCFEEVGYFDTEFVRSEDRDMRVRIAKRFRTHAIAEPLAKIRQIKSTETLGRCSASDREYYRQKLLNKMFSEGEGVPDIEKNRGRLTAHYHFIAGLAYIKEQNLSIARNRFSLAIQNHPFQIKAYIYYVSTLAGTRIFRAMNMIRKNIVAIANLYRRRMHRRKYSVHD